MCPVGADGPGSGEGLPVACGRTCLLLESRALGYRAGAVSSRLPAATCGQAARSYSWTMPVGAENSICTLSRTSAGPTTFAPTTGANRIQDQRHPATIDASRLGHRPWLQHRTRF